MAQIDTGLADLWYSTGAERGFVSTSPTLGWALGWSVGNTFTVPGTLTRLDQITFEWRLSGHGGLQPGEVPLRSGYVFSPLTAEAVRRPCTRARAVRWPSCPRCARRVGVHFLKRGTHDLRSRVCWELRYQTPRMGKSARLQRRAERLWAKAGGLTRRATPLGPARCVSGPSGGSSLSRTLGMRQRSSGRSGACAGCGASSPRDNDGGPSDTPAGGRGSHRRRRTRGGRVVEECSRDGESEPRDV